MEAQASPFRAPFDVRMRVWFNPNLESQYAMVPGLMAIVLILPAMAVALGVTREKETGTFETLSTTPIQGLEYLLGKLVVYLSLGLIGTLLALAVAVFWFRVPFRGSLLLYMLMTVVYLFATMGFCLIVAHFVASQRTATSVVLLTLFIPASSRLT
jgi:ABC-2 type transport system permease protein